MGGISAKPYFFCEYTFYATLAGLFLFSPQKPLAFSEIDKNALFATLKKKGPAFQRGALVIEAKERFLVSSGCRSNPLRVNSDVAINSCEIGELTNIHVVEIGASPPTGKSVWFL